MMAFSSLDVCPDSRNMSVSAFVLHLEGCVSAGFSVIFLCFSEFCIAVFFLPFRTQLLGPLNEIIFLGKNVLQDSLCLPGCPRTH